MSKKLPATDMNSYSDISAVFSQIEEMGNYNEDFFILSKATKILRRYAA